MRLFQFEHASNKGYYILLNIDYPYTIEQYGKLCEVKGTFKRSDHKEFEANDVTFSKLSIDDLKKEIILFLENEKFNNKFETLIND